MLIRKNTKAFKSIFEIITSCQTRADREKLLRLYITKAGHSVSDRISVEAIQSESNLFYEMNYQTVLNSLTSSHHQLHSSDEIPGIYFFRSATNKTWDETPFEFDPAIENEFSSLSELPLTRKKEKARKVNLPTAVVKSASPSGSKLKSSVPKVEKKHPQKDEKSIPSKEERIKAKKTVSHNYQLQHEIEFTDLNKVFFRQANLTKKNILDYYYNVSGILLPYLKHRSLSVFQFDELKKAAPLTAEIIRYGDEEVLPKWVDPAAKSKRREQAGLFCNDLEQLMLYVENGCVQFNASHSKSKSAESPDHIVFAVESPDHEISKAVDVVLVMNEILTALMLPSFVKLADASTLHVYIPLDSKSDFPAVRKSADYISKLIRLKIPKRVAIKGDDNEEYGKVTLDASNNAEGKNVVVPYSFIGGHAPMIAAPLLWEEVKESLNPEEYTAESVFRRYKKVGDPFETLFKTKVNADSLLESLEKHYAFLF